MKNLPYVIISKIRPCNFRPAYGRISCCARTICFYSPKYAHPKTEAEPYDLRNTVYWNPNVLTDKDGKAAFEYFNGDTKGTYRVVIEGIDDDGNLGRQVYRYKIE